MRLSLWQQFSSNHSGSFRVVGVFGTPEEAAQAEAELLALLKRIEQWGREHGEEEGIGTLDFVPPPEADYRAEHGLPERDYSLYALDSFYEGVERAITRWNHLLFVNSQETRYWPDAYHAFMRHLGGRAAIDWKMEGELLSVSLVRLTCQAPEESTATAIAEALGENLANEELYGRFAGGAPWGDDYELGVAGQVQAEGNALAFEVFFNEIQRGLPAMIRYLEAQGCTAIVYTIDHKSDEEMEFLE